MNLRKAFTLATLPLLALGSYAHADNNRGFFVGGGVSAVDVDDSPSFGSSDSTMGEIFAGYKYNPWLGAEVRYGMGTGKEELDIDGLESDDKLMLDIDNYSAVYYRAEAVNQTGRFYALLGYADIDFAVETNGVSTDFSDNDFSWGLGLGFILDEHLNLNFEYRDLVEVEQYNFTTITATLDYRF